MSEPSCAEVKAWLERVELPCTRVVFSESRGKKGGYVAQFYDGYWCEIATWCVELVLDGWVAMWMETFCDECGAMISGRLTGVAAMLRLVKGEPVRVIWCEQCWPIHQQRERLWPAHRLRVELARLQRRGMMAW